MSINKYVLRLQSVYYLIIVFALHISIFASSLCEETPLQLLQDIKPIFTSEEINTIRFGTEAFRF